MRRTIVVMLRVLVLTLLVASSLGGTAPTSVGAAPEAVRPVTVMTRNLYLGTSLAPLATAASPQDFLLKAAQRFQMVQQTNFPARAVVLAKEIKEADPVLIGLQEVSGWRRSDSLGTPATTVVYDYLPTLLDALTAQGLHYSALVTLDTTDVQVPTALGFNIRLTQRNVILAKAGLPADEFAVSNTNGSLFANLASTPIPALGTTFVSKRGWVSADVTVNKRAFRLIDTHLETVDATKRQLQAQELLQGPATTSRPVILVGDLNSEPREAAPSAYSTLTGAGFIDTWLQANPSSPLASGWTCCNAEDLLNPSPSFIVRIDHVLTRPNVTVVKSIRVGTDKDNRTPGGLWPSDHAGIVATLAP